MCLKFKHYNLVIALLLCSVGTNYATDNTENETTETTTVVVVEPVKKSFAEKMKLLKAYLEPKFLKVQGCYLGLEQQLRQLLKNAGGTIDAAVDRMTKEKFNLRTFIVNNRVRAIFAAAIITRLIAAGKEYRNGVGSMAQTTILGDKLSNFALIAAILAMVTRKYDFLSAMRRKKDCQNQPVETSATPAESTAVQATSEEALVNPEAVAAEPVAEVPAEDVANPEVAPEVTPAEIVAEVVNPEAVAAEPVAEAPAEAVANPEVAPAVTPAEIVVEVVNPEAVAAEPVAEAPAEAVVNSEVAPEVTPAPIATEALSPETVAAQPMAEVPAEAPAEVSATA